MSATILQINFDYDGSWAEYEEANAAGAGQIAGVPGLRWKIWLKNAATSEAGGIYLFHDEAAATEFATLAAGMLAEMPQVANASIKQFGVIESLTAVTRGPIAPARRAATFGQMAAEAFAVVPGVTPAQARQRMAANPDTLVIDVRDAADIAQTGTVPGAVNISYGALTYLADNEVPETWRDSRLADRSRPIVTTCILGPLGALGGKLLHDMGFSDVSVLEGGVQAWIEAGLPVTKNGSR
jgi:rhodanese-related sulfurtransferase